MLIEVAHTALSSKLDEKVANHITQCVVDAILAIRKDNNDFEPDLHMIEIQVIKKKLNYYLFFVCF